MHYTRSIIDSIRRIHRAIRNSSRTAQTELGLSGAQLLVLQLLKPGKPLSINELSEGSQTHQSSVSVVVSRLEEAELVKRSPSAADGRRVEVGLTAKGTKLLAKKAPTLAQEKLFAAIGALPDSKQKILSDLLALVVEEAGFASEPANFLFEEERSK